MYEMDGLSGTKTKKKKGLVANLTPSATKRSKIKKAKVVSVKVEGEGTFVATTKNKKGKKRIKVGTATFYASKKKSGTKKSSGVKAVKAGTWTPDF